MIELDGDEDVDVCKHGPEPKGDRHEEDELRETRRREEKTAVERTPKIERGEYFFVAFTLFRPINGVMRNPRDGQGHMEEARHCRL